MATPTLSNTVPSLELGTFTTFWGSVIAGSLLTIAIYVLSVSLMFACRVGVGVDGAISYGWGAAVWLCITAAIAFYCGGSLCSRVSMRAGLGRGAAVWALTVPLALVLLAIISGGAGLAFAGASSTHLAAAGDTAMANSGSYGSGGVFVRDGAAWTSFLMLIIGLGFSVLGSGMPATTSSSSGSVSVVH